MPYFISASAQSWPPPARAHGAQCGASPGALMERDPGHSVRDIELQPSASSFTSCRINLFAFYTGQPHGKMPLFPVPAPTHTNTQPGRPKCRARLRTSRRDRQARRVLFGCETPWLRPKSPLMREPSGIGDPAALGVLGTLPGSHARGHGAYHASA